MQTTNRHAVIVRNPICKQSYDVLFAEKTKDYSEKSSVDFKNIAGIKYEADRIISDKFLKLSWNDARIALAAINGTEVEADSYGITF